MHKEFSFLVLLLANTALCEGLILPSVNLLQKVVFDLGLNTGIDTENFLNRGFRVVALDANPAIIQTAIQRPILKSALDDGRLKILNLGISNTSGDHLDFWVPQGVDADRWASNWNLNTSNVDADLWSGAGSFDQHSACRLGDCRAILVKTITCADLLEQEGTPQYLKIDVEGRDIGCLKSIMDHRCGSQLPPYVSFENYGLDTFPEYYGENGKIKQLMQLMSVRGYSHWKRSRNWMAEYLDHPASSADSKFGEEVQDIDGTSHWKPTAAFSEKVGCDVNCDTTGFCDGFCDMHAKLDLASSNHACDGVRVALHNA